MCVGKTMLEVAKQLGVSKEVVKYHRKKLADDDYIFVKGQYYILDNGIEKIQGQLRKSKGLYSNGFESNVINKLFEIEMSLMSLHDKLDELLEK